MCLKTTQKIKTNNKEIYAYKILIFKNNILYSPYALYKYELNKILTDDKKEEIYKGSNYKLIGKGFFHAYLKLDEAKYHLEYIKTLQPKFECKIYRCTIPVNTKHYINDNFKEICSKSIKIMDEIND